MWLWLLSGVHGLADRIDSFGDAPVDHRVADTGDDATDDGGVDDHPDLDVVAGGAAE
jgi:hypothetical protein